MKAKKALEEFEQHLRRSGQEGAPSTLAGGIERMSAFYRDVRADEIDVESDGDMLLFQWGTYDWGQGLMFEVDITRQLILGVGEDDDIWHLHLTYRFPPSEELLAMGKGNRWCGRPDEVEVFVRFMMAHPATAAVGGRRDGQAGLRYECAG
jgi:hypothetical protein